MLRIVIGLFLVAHGLIHFSLTTVPAPQPAGPDTPFWPGWWRSDSHPGWLVSSLHMDSPAVRSFGSLLVMLATLGFMAAGLGLLGVPLLHEWWVPLTVFSAAISLPLFVLFWHPWLIAGAALDLFILASTLWLRWPAEIFGDI